MRTELLLAYLPADVVRNVGVAMMKRTEVLLMDDFHSGFDMTKTWALVRLPPRFSADDGIVSTSNRGLHVKAAGTNPSTGEPAFTKTSPGEEDHVKWMADTQHVSSNSIQGFDAILGKELRFTMWVSGRTFGTAAHPFGAAVADPTADLRLAAFAINTIDYETGMVFDVWMTNHAIFSYYERLNLSGAATYATFSSVFPAVPRLPGKQAKISVGYSSALGVVRWLVDDVEVARVTNIGFPAPGATTIIDHGGTPQAVNPRQMNCGMALFTLLDAGLAPAGPGLVSLAPPYQIPKEFVGGPKLFGQGAELQVARVEVLSTDEDG
jgi:hypothetical protein